MNEILTAGEQVEVVLRDLAVLIGVNDLPAPHLLSLMHNDEPGDEIEVYDGPGVLVSVLLHDMAALRRWADAADVSIEDEDGWHRAATLMDGVKVKFSAYEKGVRA